MQENVLSSIKLIAIILVNYSTIKKDSHSFENQAKIPQIFIQYYYEERNIKEISKIFNISESKVKSKLFRIRKKLKKVLNGRGYGTNE